jgi:hypothetical protein
MDLCMVRPKSRLALLPATELDEERLRAIRCYDSPMQVQTVFTRTSKLNRWWRGLCARVAAAIDANPDALHAEIKFKCGLIDQIIPVRSGTTSSVAIRLKSTAFPVMEDADFSLFCDRAVELLFRDYLPDVRSKQRAALIAEWAGRRPRLDPPPQVRA